MAAHDRQNRAVSWIVSLKPRTYYSNRLELNHLRNTNLVPIYVMSYIYIGL